MESVKAKLSQIKWRDITQFFRHNKNVLIFLSGFLFDVITIERIDALSDILIQIAYLGGLTYLLIYQYRDNKGVWAPSERFKKAWSFNVEALHFFYGGLLSAYVILYLKSTSGARAVLFIILMAALLIINEMPQIRRIGYRLRLGLYAFCVCSFLIYFIPILLGRIGIWVFLLSILISAAFVWVVAGRLAVHEEKPRDTQWRLFAPAGVLIGILLVLYVMRLIPPVPLSVQFQGIFHQVERKGAEYRLSYPKPPFYAFWRSDSQPFLAREEDHMVYFARVFAPARFKHKVFIRWEFFNETKKKFMTTDLLPMPVVGGRADGFRGYSVKEKFQIGKWKVTAETKDGRAIGFVKFRVKADTSEKPRKWKHLTM